MFVYLLVTLSFLASIKCLTEQKSTGRHIVVLRDDISKQNLNALVSDIREADEDASLPDVHCTIHNVVDTVSKMLIVTASKGALDKLSRMKEVSFIEEDKTVEGAMTPYLSWALDRLDQEFLPFDQHYQPTASGAGVDVYVVDSGINYAHEEFEGRAFYGGYDGVASSNGSDCHGHGTHIASLIGGKTFGVAKQVKLYSIRILDCNNLGLSSDLVSALDLIAKRIIQTKNPSVVNLSLRGLPSDFIDNATRAMYELGVPLVVSAGNGKGDACDYSPARSQSVLTVAATTADDSPYLRRPGTNFGKCVDIFAPGDYVLGASFKCNNCCRPWSGTSMATGLVSGVLALYLEKQPFLTAQQLYNKVLSDAINGTVKMTVDGVPVQFRNQTTTKLVKVMGGCGGDFVYKSVGHLYSPNFPLNYPSKLLCTWRIIARAGEEVKVVIEKINLAQNDTLTIIDGNSPLMTVLAKLTGKSGRRKKFRSKSHLMMVILVTNDGGMDGQGFKLKYTKRLAGENTLAKSVRPSVPPTPVPLPTSPPLTETRDSKLFMQVDASKIQSLVNKWQKKEYFMKHIQATQFVTSTGETQTGYNIVLSNLSLHESIFVVEVNHTELLKHYRKARKQYVPTVIAQVIYNNDLLYSAIFTRKNNRTRKHVVYWNDNLSQHAGRMKYMKSKGYLLKAQTFTHHRDHYYISSIYQATTTTRDWFIEHNLTLYESLHHTRYYQNSHVMTSITPYRLGNAIKFAVIFEAVNHPDYTLWMIWDRTSNFIGEVVKNYTAPNDDYEITAIVGFESYYEIRYILTLGLRRYHYD